jgi:dienelactone hydrolase
VFELKLHGDDVYFVEVRPLEEKARYSIMKVGSGGGSSIEIIPAPFHARSTVHEYGGGGFLLAGERIAFSNFTDQRLYTKKVNSNEIPIPITPAGIDARYADGIFDETRRRIISVRELHPIPGKRDAMNTIVGINIENSGSEEVLLFGNDFYAFPRLSPDATKLAWVTWNFPNMPFDGSELWVGEFNSEGMLHNKSKIAGGLDESVSQPNWSPSGDLYFISDRTGWWNLYRWRERNFETLCPKSSDFCHPDWNLGFSSYALESEKRIICTFAENGEWKLASLEIDSLDFKLIESPFTDIQHVQASEGYAVFLAGSPRESHCIFRYDFSSGEFQKIYESAGESADDNPISLPTTITFPTSNHVSAHGFFYEPHNPKFVPSKSELPPLIVTVHGGPTHASSNALHSTIQFFTSRGFAVLDVNYGGSSAYGREYRRRLNGQWGIVDVEDCVNGAMSLAREGKIDAKRVVIRGGSAGGWTTLCALTFSKMFKAGACSFGISDLERWELDCHKFESQYLHSLIGSYPQERELFLDRSPTSYVENISAPLLVLQGLEDRVVPPSQSELIVEGLRRMNRSAEYVAFEGEQHNFRQAKHVEEALEKELSFFLSALAIKVESPTS